jgi:hypothetical protein
MSGVLDLTAPAHLLAKLEHEFAALSADRGNSYAAINALRDAFHLREWIWNDRLKNDDALQNAVMGQRGGEDKWNYWVNQNFTGFPVIRELCNGSKHFNPGGLIRNTHRAGWGSKASFWDNPDSGWDDNSFYVEVDAGRLIAVTDLVQSIVGFWRGLFAKFPQLG